MTVTIFNEDGLRRSELRLVVDSDGVTELLMNMSDRSAE